MSIEALSVATIRSLALDSVEHARHGHLGMPLGAAPMAYSLFRHHMKHLPSQPDWFDRDRFILTSGHGSILLYSLLHLSGYDLSIEDLQHFRQLDSHTPGHPEVGHTPGVEATTGPLGQGFAMSVGFALAEAHLAERFNKPDCRVVDHYTYTICGDGDLEEGVAIEAATIAGNLSLGKLIVLYDANRVTSDGPLTLSNQEDIEAKFQAMGWQVSIVEDGNDIGAINQALEMAKQSPQPSLIIVHTVIGYGSRLQGTNKIHSNPVGPDEVSYIKAKYGWKYGEFEVPDEVAEDFRSIEREGQIARESWLQRLKDYRESYPEDYVLFEKVLSGDWDLGSDFEAPFTETKLATRTASGLALNRAYQAMPVLLGGSADLASSNKTTISDAGFMTADSHGVPNIHFGVREFAMAAIGNGVCLHGGLRGYCGTFLVFSDYMRSAIRHSALMGMPMIYIMTHDSILVGQDGPTHQPVEHLLSLRAMPNLVVYRPADANETLVGWRLALESQDKPYVLALGRHDVPVLSQVNMQDAAKGAYILEKDADEPDLILIATGSEVETALEVKKQLRDYRVNIVSMPSWELFDEQDQAYRNQVLPPSVTKRLSLEWGTTIGWERYVGPHGRSIGVNEFGKSAPAKDLVADYGLTVDEIVAIARDLIETE